MPRITKPREERRLEIIMTAQQLFAKLGYANCSVDRIIREMGVAKGTFYYYFKSKEEILSAIAGHTLAQVEAMVEQVANDPSLDALGKMKLLLSDSHIGDEKSLETAEMLHLPENRELHELTNIQSVLRLSPHFAKIVEQGNRESVFCAERPIETIQFLFTGTQFLLDGGLFHFTEEEVSSRRRVAQSIIEKALGAAPGSFGFMNPEPTKGE